MKYSYQRDLILQVIKHWQGHLTAMQVYEQVKKELPTISLGTVYRNLNVLNDQNAIRRIVVPYGCDEFDYNPKEHSHFFCTKCENIYDLEEHIDQKMKHMVEETTGYEITNTNVVFQGICQRCHRGKEG